MVGHRASERVLSIHGLAVVMRDPICMNGDFGRDTGYGPMERPAVHLTLVDLADVRIARKRLCRRNASGAGEGQTLWPNRIPGGGCTPDGNCMRPGTVTEYSQFRI